MKSKLLMLRRGDDGYVGMDRTRVKGLVEVSESLRLRGAALEVLDWCWSAIRHGEAFLGESNRACWQLSASVVPGTGSALYPLRMVSGRAQ
ncbi:hypothetical protein [Haliangium sp.]|uniref:hypothetical protein n=1 Tax=Haliangium sp. TaxID=2663208 RepID=UPI003D14922C